MEDHLKENPQRGLYLFGAVLQTFFFIIPIYVVSVYLISLGYFVQRKKNAVLERQFDLSFKHRFLVFWAYTIGFLQLSTLLTRTFIIIHTRFWLEPIRDTNTVVIELCELWISVVDWVTPFSLLYLYKHIGSSKGGEQKRGKDDKYEIIENTVGTEKIKSIL